MKLSRVLTDQESKEGTKPMNQMEPLEVCVIHDQESGYHGRLVMRTANSEEFEVMDLTDLETDSYWGKNSNTPVKPYTGKSITFILE